MKVIWSAASLRHLDQIAEYLQGETSGGAISMRRRILETKRRISQMPMSGKAGRVNGTREAFVPRTPFTLVYRVTAEHIEILGIWHSAREWPQSF